MRPSGTAVVGRCCDNSIVKNSTVGCEYQQKLTQLLINKYAFTAFLISFRLCIYPNYCRFSQAHRKIGMKLVADLARKINRLPCYMSAQILIIHTCDKEDETKC